MKLKEIQYIDPNLFSPKDAWDKLSLTEKAEMMKVAVSHGIMDLKEIRDKYNEYAAGGSLPQTDWSYDSWKKQIATYKGINVDSDRTYDYEGFFRKYPQEAWAMLRNDPNAHFSDEFKTVYHPTFSAPSPNNDGSIYSGVKHPLFNPEGLTGGTWSPDYKSFTMSPDGYRGPVSMDERKWYLENTEDNGVQLREANGSIPIYDNIPWAGVLPAVTVTGRKHSIGGPLVDYLQNEYSKGGGIYIKPSHRGRLTELKKRTGKTEAELYNDGNPAHKKMVVFARSARKWKHSLGGYLLQDAMAHVYGPGGDITYGYPFYSYDNNGQLILDENGKPIINYNATIPEVTIIPDSKKSPAQRNEDERARQKNLRDYDENRSREYTTRQVAQAQRNWENSDEKKALDYAQSAAMGIGIGADIVSGLPIYSSLKGASTLSRAESPLEYAEGTLWLTPILGKTYQYTKPIVTEATQEAARQIQNVGREMGNPFAFAENMYNFARRKSIPFSEKQAAAQRMEDLIHSPEYIQKQKNAGLSDSEILDFQNMVSRRLNNGNFPAYTMKRKSNGLSLTLPKPFGGIYLREGMPSSDFLNSFDHEVAHYSTVNFGKDGNGFLGWLNKENPAVMEKVMNHNINLVPYRNRRDALKVRDARNLDASNDWYNNPKNQDRLSYYRDEQELRSNAYAMLQEAQRRGMTIDEFVDYYTMQSTGEIFDFAPSSLKFMNYAYTPENLKKYLKGVLSISTPLTLGIKAIDND